VRVVVQLASVPGLDVGRQPLLVDLGPGEQPQLLPPPPTAPSPAAPGVAQHRSGAPSGASRPQRTPAVLRQALAELEPLAEPLDRYPLFHAARAEFLHDLDDKDAAALADRRARELTANPAQQVFLDARLGGLGTFAG
jgi:hypothetical protein